LLDEQISVAEAAASVNLRDLAELRSFRNPPGVVCQVLEAVAMLLGVPNPRWDGMRKLLDGNFITRIGSFDPALVTPQQTERLRVLLQVSTFSDGSLSERCPAVVSLAAWCNAVGRQLSVAPHVGKGSAPGHTSSKEAIRSASMVAADGDVSEQISLTSSALSMHPAAPSSAATSSRVEVCGLIVEPNLWSLSEVDLARVRNLCVSRENVGSVTFIGETDCRDLRNHLCDVVVLNIGEVIVYPNQKMKQAMEWVRVSLRRP
jgi:hypothetical protein